MKLVPPADAIDFAKGSIEHAQFKIWAQLRRGVIDSKGRKTKLAKKQLLLLVSLMLVGSVFLVAYIWKDQGYGGKITPVFRLDVGNKGEVLEDGELIYGLVSKGPFEGTLNRVFYSGAPDAEIMSFFDESLLAVDGDYLITNDGAATYKTSKDNKTITITIKDGVKWHDGEPVKASDLLYAYQLLGHPDYEGTRYTFTISNIEGMPDYHEGKTDKISGINVSEDEKTIAITYKEATPSLISGIWTVPVPRHFIGDVTTGEVTIEDIVRSDKIRTRPIGFGPYKVVKVIPGESVMYERYNEYWRGKPNLQRVILKVVAPESILGALKKGEVDIATIPTDQYLNAKKVDNIELLAKLDSVYTYIGFKLGKWDADKKENVLDPNAKLANKLVRQAMWHAMDNEAVGKYVFHDLRFPATTLITPVFERYHDRSNLGRSYDPEKAKALLDKAGYIDKNNDGIRENPDGTEFVLNFVSMNSDEASEPIAKYYIQNWADVGIRVELLDGRLHEFNAFYKMIENDNPKVDLYQGAWSTGSDPDPEGLYGRTALYNYTRYTSRKNDELLVAGTSEKAFDSAYRKDIYNQWQALMVEDVPVAPTVYRYGLTAVNKRVANYSVDPGSDLYLYEMGVTEK